VTQSGSGCQRKPCGVRALGAPKALDEVFGCSNDGARWIKYYERIPLVKSEKKV